MSGSRLEQARQRAADHRLVLGDQHPDHGAASWLRRGVAGWAGAGPPRPALQAARELGTVTASLKPAVGRVGRLKLGRPARALAR